MPTLSDDDVERIADAMVTKIRAQKHDFWIDPERHYQDHSALQELVRQLSPESVIELKGAARAFSSVKKIFGSLVVGLIAVGALILALVGITGKLKGP